MIPSAVRSGNRDIPKIEYRYTLDSELDQILREYVQACDTASVWLSVEAEGLHPTILGPAFNEVLRSALESAMGNCIEASTPRGRFIKLRSRDAQNQIFVKIEYACETGQRMDEDRNLMRIRKLVETAGGYVSTAVDRDRGYIKVAIPKKK